MERKMETKKNMYLDAPSDESLSKLFSELGDVGEDFKLRLNKQDEIQSKSIKPTPGICVKVKDEKGNKVFFNICHSPELPKPNDITEAELTKILESDEPSSYRIPLSLGEPSADKAKDGQDCTCYDVIVNSEYFHSIKKNTFYTTFLISVCFEGIEDKYNIKLNRADWVILKNKKYHGIMPEHHIRKKPLIAELGSQANELKKVAVKSEPPVTEVKGVIPNYTLKKYPVDGHPQMIKAEVNLPELVTGDSVRLYVGEDRLLLQEKKDLYHIDIFLPYFLLPDSTEAEFNLCNKVLTVSIPVAPMLLN